MVLTSSRTWVRHGLSKLSCPCPRTVVVSVCYSFLKCLHFSKTTKHTCTRGRCTLSIGTTHTHTHRDGRDPTIACGGDSIFYFHQERALDTITHRHTRNKLSSCTTGAFPPARNNKVEKSKSRLSSKDAPAPSTAQVFQP